MAPLYTLNASATAWEARGRASVAHGPDYPAWPPVPGTYIPGPTSTGIRVPKEELTVHEGNLIVTQNNRVIENLYITGQLHIRAANVYARNIYVAGGVPTGDTGLVVCTDIRCINFVIEDSTIIPSLPHYYWTGMIGHDYTARRVHTQWGVDSYGVFNVPNPDANPRVIIEDCYMGPLALFSPNPLHANTDNRTHNDQIQVQQGVGTDEDPSVIIRRNAMWGYLAGGIVFPERWPGMDLSTSNPLSNPPNIKWGLDIRDAITGIVQVTSNVRRPGETLAVPVTGLRIEGNWFYGSAVGISFAGGGPTTPPRNPGVIINNWFDGQQRLNGLQGTANAWCISVKSPEYGDKNVLQGTWINNINGATNTPARIGFS